MGQFAQIPNETLRDERLSYLARGLLGEALSHAETWRHEGADETHRRARQARGAKAEGRRRIDAACAELEEQGYRHRLLWRQPGGEFVNELRYYAVPAKCGDARCVNCHRPDQAKHDVSAGRPRGTGTGTSGVTWQNTEFAQVGTEVP